MVESKFSRNVVKLSVAGVGAGAAIRICGSVEPEPNENIFCSTTVVPIFCQILKSFHSVVYNTGIPSLVGIVACTCHDIFAKQLVVEFFFHLAFALIKALCFALGNSFALLV
jgi:hypothetical protein